MPQGVIVLIALTLFVLSASAQNASFIWRGGPSVINAVGTTVWPSGRAGCAVWRRTSGGLILYGGNTSTGLLGDMWTMSEDSQGGLNWTRVLTTTSVGVYTGISPRPGPRQGASTWLNEAGTGGYLFGGLGVGSSITIGYLNDLWFLDFNTLQWTWIGGSSTINGLGTYPATGTNEIAYPRSRYYAIVAQRNTDVYLFGGAFASTATSTAWTYLSDFFKFDLATREFTWVGGRASATVANYSSGRIWPGGRESSTVWWRGDTFYMALGFGYTTSLVSSGYVQEIWAYDTVTGQWRFRHGTNLVNQPATYTTQPLVQSYSAVPGSREDAVGFTLSDGVLIFGGTGYSTGTTASGWLADAWLFDEVNSLWIWYGGGQGVNRLGTYNSIGATGWPGGCAELSTYITSSYVAILMGRGYGSSAGNGYLSAFWSITLPSSVRAAVNFAAVPSQPLSTGALVGIIVGSIVGGVLLISLSILAIVQCRKRHVNNPGREMSHVASPAPVYEGGGGYGGGAAPAPSAPVFNEVTGAYN